MLSVPKMIIATVAMGNVLHNLHGHLAAIEFSAWNTTGNSYAMPAQFKAKSARIVHQS